MVTKIENANIYKLKQKREGQGSTIYLIENRETHYEYLFGKVAHDPSLYYYSDLLLEWVNVDARPEYGAIFRAAVL